MSAPFRHRLRVRFSDCDLQGVVFYANHLTYYDIAITELWREVAGSYEEMSADGIDLMVAEASIRYLRPVPFDAWVELTASVTRLGNTSMTSRLAVLLDGEKASEGELRHVFVRAGTNRKTPIPAEIRAGLEAHLAEG
ncbi:MAG: thioesterase family protein [Solirubrobacterales bacterium]